MRKLFLILTMTILMVSCGVKVTGYEFNDTIAKDKAIVDSISQSEAVNFCEAQGKFAYPFNKKDKEYEVVWMQTVFQVDSLVYILTHPDNQYKTEPVIEIYNDIWIGDLYSPIEVKVELKESIQNLRKSDLDVPETPFFVLRRPIVKPPFPEYMYYIFGSTQKGAIKVDSNTGEISEL